MQTTEVSDGVVFAYTDSGAPPKDDYLTVIVLHGHTFHSGEHAADWTQASMGRLNNHTHRNFSPHD